MHKFDNAWISALAAAGIMTAAGCGTSRLSQLERVAKDWCETIRASQIIPVYPLTEDIQPGDVFLVQVPVDRQQQIYRDKGFLPLDNHLARLDPDTYAAFYDRSFIPLGATPSLPADWMRPAGGASAAWADAPNAAFPTYSFSVTRSGGLNLAVPISGVPVGLSLLGTQSAKGAVNIKKARTLGVDTVSLFDQLADWADEHNAFIAHFGAEPGTEPRNYLRVVTRIYTTGELDVQLSDARSVGGGGDAGLARPVELFAPTLPDADTSAREAARENYDRGLAHINNMARARDTPMHASGDDAGLSPDEARARAEARAAELERQKSDAKTEVDTRRDAAETARDNARTEADALRAAKQRRDAAKTAHARAQRELRDAQAEHERALASSAATPEEREAAARDVEENQAALQTAESGLSAAEDALGAARAAYEPRAREIARADVELAAANAALERLEGFAPGASFRFTAVSARSVSLTETFSPPLIIGYLGFDVPVLAGGGLGRPIPTHAVIDRAFGVDLGSAAHVARQLADTSILNAMYDAIATDPGPEARRVARALDRLTEYVPDTYPKVERAGTDGAYTTADTDLDLRADGDVNFLDYTRFFELRETNRRVLERILDRRSLTVPGPDGQPRRAGRSDYARLRRLIGTFDVPHDERLAFERARRDLLSYYRESTPMRP